MRETNGMVWRIKAILSVLLFILSDFKQAFASPEPASNFWETVLLLVTGHTQYFTSEGIIFDHKP